LFEHLQIYEARERWMVGIADLGLAAVAAPLRLIGGRRQPTTPGRILLFRLERIGDLLMTLPGIAAVRELAPAARIDLVVGSWNEPIARLIEGIDGVHVFDAGWLSRGRTPASARRWVQAARAWRHENYDLAINFEGDIRSHALMAMSRAARRAGFDMAGGGPLLTTRVPYDPAQHVAYNILRLVEHAFGIPRSTLPLTWQRLRVPGEARERAEKLLVSRPEGRNPREERPEGRDGHDETETLIGVQVGGGRQVKQWEPARFGALVAALAARHPARFVFTGSQSDRALVDAALAHVPAGVPVVDLVGRADLPTLAALLEKVSVFITGDTGPMHLAAAVGAPIVAIFGPSDPRRWGPLCGRPAGGRLPSGDVRIVHSRVACRPCNRIRRPPAHCVGLVPECLQAITVEQVLGEVELLLAAAESHARR
jgi:ADP-heptose:LPS heptosyltransferase